MGTAVPVLDAVRRVGQPQEPCSSQRMVRVVLKSLSLSLSGCHLSRSREIDLRVHVRVPRGDTNALRTGAGSEEL